MCSTVLLWLLRPPSQQKRVTQTSQPQGAWCPRLPRWYVAYPLALGHRPHVSVESRPCAQPTIKLPSRKVRDPCLPSAVLLPSCPLPTATAITTATAAVTVTVTLTAAPPRLALVVLSHSCTPRSNNYCCCPNMAWTLAATYVRESRKRSPHRCTHCCSDPSSLPLGSRTHLSQHWSVSRDPLEQNKICSNLHCEERHTAFEKHWNPIKRVQTCER